MLYLNGADAEQRNLHDVQSLMEKDVIHSAEIGALIALAASIVHRPSHRPRGESGLSSVRVSRYRRAPQLRLAGTGSSPRWLVGPQHNARRFSQWAL